MESCLVIMGIGHSYSQVEGIPCRLRTADHKSQRAKHCIFRKDWATHSVGLRISTQNKAYFETGNLIRSSFEASETIHYHAIVIHVCSIPLSVHAMNPLGCQQ